ncbi:MAG: DUF2799 domain-containing protein [Bdellovibrionota bacterium]
MKTIKRLKFAIGTVLLASACLGCAHRPAVTKTAATCVGIDWWETGRTDGVSGHAVFKLDEHKRRCSDTETPVDVDLYLNGRDAGLIDFCTPQQGFAAGHSGANYENVCPLHLEPAFLRAFETGARLSALESQDLDLESRIDNLTRLLRTQQAGTAVRSQLEQLRSQRAELVSEMSKLEKSSATTSSLQ